MNSIYHCYSEEETETHNTCKDPCRHPIPGHVLLRCNNGGFGPRNVNFETPRLPVTFNQPIASVTIDTTYLKCPRVLINFVGILTVTPVTNTAISTLNFTLFRMCKGDKIRQPVSTFTFSTVVVTDSPDSRTLNFQYSSCGSECGDCCIYTLELTSISNGINTGVLTYSINGELCELAIEAGR